MRYSGRCGAIALFLFLIVTGGGVRAGSESSGAQALASIKADLQALKERVEQIANETVGTRDEVDFLREDLTALQARVGAETAPLASNARQGGPITDVEVTGSIGRAQLRDPAQDEQRARAEQLLQRGDIAGARMVLTNWLRSGNPLAAFKLADLRPEAPHGIRRPRCQR